MKIKLPHPALLPVGVLQYAPFRYDEIPIALLDQKQARSTFMSKSIRKGTCFGQNSTRSQYEAKTGAARSQGEMDTARRLTRNRLARFERPEPNVSSYQGLAFLLPPVSPYRTGPGEGP